MPNLIERQCCGCGKSFQADASECRRGKARFCSRPCAAAHRQPPLVNRFWAKVIKGDGCWLWTGTIINTGYGQIRESRSGTERSFSTHRLSWELHFGPIPDGMQVLHRCDVRACVRPDHLFLGTVRDNHADKVRKGRQTRGVMIFCAKLDDATVREIRRRYAAGGSTQQALADEFGVTKPHIWQIINRRRWKHVL